MTRVTVLIVAAVAVMASSAQANISGDAILLMDVLGGGVTSDSSGNGFDGSQEGSGATLSSDSARGGNDNKSISLDGATGFTITNDVEAIDLSDSFSIATWVKFASIGSNQTFFYGKEAPAYDGRGMTLSYRNSEGGVGRLSVNGSGGGAEVFGATPLVDADTWYHIVGVVDRSSNTASLYVNGALDGSTDISGLGDTHIEAGHSGTYRMNFGTEFNASGPVEGLQGLLDEGVVLTRAVSATEVQNLYANGIPEPATLGLMGVGMVLMLRRRRAA